MLAALMLCTQLCSAEAFHHYQRLLVSGKWGLDGQEKAAFLVADAGRLRLVQWPGGGSYRASYRGIVPQGVVAIIHTHRLRETGPSTHDRAEARRVGMPIVVITPQAVTVAYPDGSVAALAR